MKIFYKIVQVLFVILVLTNLGFFDYKYWQEKKAGDIALTPKNEEISKSEASISADFCGASCQETIKNKIEEELNKLPNLAGQSSVSPSIPKPKTSPATNQPKIVYIPLVSSGNVSSINWTDIVPSEFYFDLSDYPSVKEVRFEAFLLSANGDLVSARLYDQSNKRGVDYSELQSSNSVFTRLQSSATKIWRGNNKYTVQLKSVNGTGVQLREAKLIIIF